MQGETRTNEALYIRDCCNSICVKKRLTIRIAKMTGIACVVCHKACVQHAYTAIGIFHACEQDETLTNGPLKTRDYCGKHCVNKRKGMRSASMRQIACVWRQNASVEYTDKGVTYSVCFRTGFNSLRLTIARLCVWCEARVKSHNAALKTAYQSVNISNKYAELSQWFHSLAGTNRKRSRMVHTHA